MKLCRLGLLSLFFVSALGFADGTVTVTGQNQSNASVQQITIEPGSSLIVETVGNGLIQYSCPASAGPVVQPSQTWLCSFPDKWTADDGEVTVLSIVATGQGPSKADAYNAAIANCKSQVEKYDTPNANFTVNENDCSSVLPDNTTLKCQTL